MDTTKMDSIKTSGDFKIRIGTDICSTKRVQEAYERFGDRLLSKIMTEDERNYVLGSSHHTVARIAGRFAVKEACSKVLGVGWRGIGFRDIEVIKEASGKPGLLLHGRAKMLADSLNLKFFEVSLSHEHEFATAFVLAHNGR